MRVQNEKVLSVTICVHVLVMNERELSRNL